MSARGGFTQIRTSESTGGFTLIELLVVCAIIVVITALVLVDNNKFGGEVLLENLAYDVALSVRQAQVYGIAVERFGASDFNAGYGMQFSLATPTEYHLFADLDGNGIYDASKAEDVPPSPYMIQQGYAITGLCVISNSAAAGSACTNQVSEIDILYIRPEPDAYISAGSSGSVGSCYQNQAADCNYEAQITLTSPKGDTRTVLVDATGQISVQLQ